VNLFFIAKRSFKQYIRVPIALVMNDAVVFVAIAIDQAGAAVMSTPRILPLTLSSSR
jgi:hypothetical protein